jgi:prepilin-type processing-associated H-X9-DG protein
MMRESDIVPDYFVDPKTLICPGPQPVIPTPHIDDTHYIYFGYAMLTDADVQTFAQSYAAELAGGGDFTADFPVVTSYGNTLMRLRDGGLHSLHLPAEDFVGNHQIPVMMEWPGQHEGLTGGHVVYLDGHSEFIEYPGRFPMTESTVAVFDSIATWQRTTAWNTKDFTPTHDPHLQSLCQTNLRSLGVSFKTFSGIAPHESFPKLSSTPGKFMFDTYRVVPFHVDELIRLSCPASPYACATPAVDDQSYFYPGYVLLDDGDVAAFATAYAAQLSAGGDFEEDLPIATSYGTALVRIWEGVPHYSVPSSMTRRVYQHEIPVLIEWPDNHDDLRGGNVLYMDGHVEWLEYPGQFPMTVATMNFLTTLAGRPPIN